MPQKTKRTAIFFHADPDGIVSAVNVLLSQLAGEKPSLFPLRKQEELPTLLKKAKGRFSQVFILDLAPNEADVLGLSERTIIIDHHKADRPIVGKGIMHLNPRLSGKPPYPACYQTYILFGGRDWQVFCGVVDDWGVGLVPTFAQRMLKPYGWFGSQENLYLYSDAGKIAFAIESAVKFYGEKKGALIALKALLASKTPQKFLAFSSRETAPLKKASEEIARQVALAIGKGGLVSSSKKLEVYEIKSRYNIKREVIQRLKIERPGKYVLVYLKGKSKTDFSLRGPGRIPELVSPYGGGHPEAGGGRVPNSKLKEFLSEVEKRIASPA